MALAGVLSLGVMACKKDSVDTEKPSISIISPAAGTTLKAGGDVVFKCKFSDNEGLDSYKMNIHWGEDHDHGADGHRHEHKGHEGKEHHFDGVRVIVEGNGTLEGAKDKTVERTFRIEKKKGDKHVVNGKYHVMVHCLDKAGNESSAHLEVKVEGGEEHHHE